MYAQPRRALAYCPLLPAAGQPSRPVKSIHRDSRALTTGPSWARNRALSFFEERLPLPNKFLWNREGHHYHHKFSTIPFTSQTSFLKIHFNYQIIVTTEWRFLKLRTEEAFRYGRLLRIR
jgi:hypothetical protein